MNIAGFDLPLPVPLPPPSQKLTWHRQPVRRRTHRERRPSVPTRRTTLIRVHMRRPLMLVLLLMMRRGPTRMLRALHLVLPLFLPGITMLLLSPPSIAIRSPLGNRSTLTHPLTAHADPLATRRPIKRPRVAPTFPRRRITKKRNQRPLRPKNPTAHILSIIRPCRLRRLRRLRRQRRCAP